MKEDNTNQVAEQLISLINQQIEEKLATKKKLKNTIANRSKERKEEIGKKHRDALKKHYE